MEGAVVEILDGDLRLLAEGHRPVAVQAAARVDADRQRADLGILAPAAGEQVAHRRLHRGLGLAVPIEAENVEPHPADVGAGDPYLLDRALAVDFRQRAGGVRLDVGEGRDLPAAPQFPGGMLADAFGRHRGTPFLAGEVLGADRAGLRGRGAEQVSQVDLDAVQRRRSLGASFRGFNPNCQSHSEDYAKNCG